MSTLAPAAPTTEPGAEIPGLPAGMSDGDDGNGAGPRLGGRGALACGAAAMLGAAAVVCFAAFLGRGSEHLGATTTVEVVLTLLAGVAIAAAVLLTPRGRRIAGAWPVGLLLALTGLTAISASWSVTPDASWQEANLMLAYSAVFIAAVALARLAPNRCEAVLGGIALAAVVVCGYALLMKVFPTLERNNHWARLLAPFGYWNATGLAAAMGLIACLWLGARRTGHALVNALAYPAAGLLMVTLMLSYSRGALIVAAIGVALWLCIVPLRLRGATLLIVAGACAAGVVSYDFASSVLSSEGVALASRASAGHRLGVLLLAMLLVLLALGIAIGFAAGRRAPSQVLRRRMGAALLALLAIAVLAVVGALAASQRGFTGTISHGVSTLTNPSAPPPANTPGRLTALSSVRARYWKEALQVFSAHPALGAGGGGYATASLHYRPANLDAKHAHGYVVQTLADLGIVGAILTLALLVAWTIAAGNATHPFNRRWSGWRWRSMPLPYTSERVALLSMLCVVVTFGLHSFVDWTWYVPGTACMALICAGWLAGRGPLREPLDAGPGRWRHLTPSGPSRVTLAVAAIALAAALLAAWAQWQPQRSVEDSENALTLLGANKSPKPALAAAEAAVSHDPLSAQALLRLSDIQQLSGHTRQATATLRRAVRLQPANPETWYYLGQHELNVVRDARAAVRELQAALYLNPQQLRIQNEYVRALRAAKEPRGG